jgi:hypothetical protein
VVPMNVHLRSSSTVRKHLTVSELTKGKLAVIGMSSKILKDVRWSLKWESHVTHLHAMKTLAKAS